MDRLPIYCTFRHSSEVRPTVGFSLSEKWSVITDPWKCWMPIYSFHLSVKTLRQICKDSDCFTKWPSTWNTQVNISPATAIFISFCFKFTALNKDTEKKQTECSWLNFYLQYIKTEWEINEYWWKVGYLFLERW